MGIGVVLIIIGVFIPILTFWPVIRAELGYIFHNKQQEGVPIVFEASQQEVASDAIVPANKQFAVVVPKIGANAPVTANINPFESAIYQEALTRGVAHAAGSSFPTDPGNTFLFAHSAGNFYEANRYNAVFYLLNKLKSDDIFYIVYEGTIYKYRVRETKIVDAEAVEYLTNKTSKRVATLMTCWPPGTTLQRFLVIGELVTS